MPRSSRESPANTSNASLGQTRFQLAIEVADKSLAHDRGVKKRAYAASRIPTYWIVNLVDRCIEVLLRADRPCDQTKRRTRLP